MAFSSLLLDAFYVILWCHARSFLESHKEWVAAFETAALCKCRDGEVVVEGLLGQMLEHLDALLGNEIVVVAM